MIVMKIVNKAREIKAFTTKQLDNIVIEKNNEFYFIKCTFDKGKGQFEVVIHKDDFNRLLEKEVREKVEQLLKEIDRKEEQIERSKVIDIHTKSSFKASLDWCKRKIRKAFEGVVEE